MSEKERAGLQAEVVPILDGARPSDETLLADLNDVRAVAADPSRSLEERLEAIEIIFDSEIGDTHFTRARNIEREFGIRMLFVKFEGGNTTGTQKDRIAFTQAMDAIRRGFDTVTAATCGNYGVAVALAASCAGLRAVIYVPATYKTRRTEEMERLGAEIRRHPGDYEATVDGSREQAEKNEWYDCNPGGENTLLQMRTYGRIAEEIWEELRDAPRAVAVPVSNGTTLAGVHRGFLTLFRRGKTSRMPRIVGGSSYGKNPIVQSFVRGLDECLDLDPASIRETHVNEPLINWHSTEGNEALHAIRSTGGWASYASDRAMIRCSRLFREKEGLSVLPAATAGLIALLDRHAKDPLVGDRYVAVLTGRR
jgi:threonine synthase